MRGKAVSATSRIAPLCKNCHAMISLFDEPIKIIFLSGISLICCVLSTLLVCPISSLLCSSAFSLALFVLQVKYSRSFGLSGLSQCEKLLLCYFRVRRHERSRL